MPSAGIRDVLVVSLKEEKQVRFHSTYTASHEIIYLHLAIQNLNDRTMMKASRRVATVEEFYSILEQVHSKDCLYMRAQKRHLPRFARFKMFLMLTCMQVILIVYMASNCGHELFEFRNTRNKIIVHGVYE